MKKLLLLPLLLMSLTTQARPHHPQEGRVPEPLSFTLPEIGHKAKLRERLPVQLTEPMAKLARAKYSPKQKPGRH